MSCVYHNLPPTMSEEFTALCDEAETLGLDPTIISALLIAPLVSGHITEAEGIVGQRLDTLRQAMRKNATPIMRLLSRLSLRLFLDYLNRLRSANHPWQKTRWRIVLCCDDSLLVHAEESQQPDMVNMWSTLYKTYRKAHDLIVLGVTVGPKSGNFFFPLWVELWHQPGQRQQTRPQRMAAALLRLNQQLQEIGSSLDGIDCATDNGYLSPTVALAINACGLVFTTRFKSTQKLTTLDGEPIVIKELLSDLTQHHPIRVDSRAETQGYYWRKDVVHPYLGQGTLVIQRRKVRSGGFQYHYHFSQHQNAKAITVLQLAKRRWPIEVFFRESKQQLGMGHLPYRKWASMRGHVAIRGLLYFLLCKVRSRLRWPKSQKTVGALKRRFRHVFTEIFQSLFPLNAIDNP